MNGALGLVLVFAIYAAVALVGVYIAGRQRDEDLVFPALFWPIALPVIAVSLLISAVYDRGFGNGRPR